jgi:hypothetical protein
MYVASQAAPLVQQQDMTTPSMAFSVCARNAAAAFVALWLAAMVVTRLYALHEEYVAELGIRDDERWLVERCKEPEFYANLRQHSDLCTRVVNNAHASIALRVLSRVMERSTHLCGDSSCTDAVTGLAARFGWHAVAVLAAAMVLAPNLLLLMLRAAVQRRIVRRMEEEAMLFDHHAAMYRGPTHGWFSDEKSFPLTSAGAFCRRSLYFNRPVQYIGAGAGSGTSSLPSAGIVESPPDEDDDPRHGHHQPPQHAWLRNIGKDASSGGRAGFDGGVARLL